MSAFARTSDYESQIEIWPRYIMHWADVSPRLTTPGETKALVEAILFGDGSNPGSLSYISGLNTFSGSGPWLVSDTNADFASAYIAALGAAIAGGFDSAGDGDKLAALIDSMAHHHESAGNDFQVNITNIATGNPTVITAPGHNAQGGYPIRISQVSGNTPNINNDYIPTAISGDDISIAVNTTVAGTGGRVTVPFWGGLIFSPRVCSELAEGAIRNQALLTTPQIDAVKAALIDECTNDEAGGTRSVRYQVKLTDTAPFSGDSEAETQGWYSRCLRTAELWMPSNPSVSAWAALRASCMAAAYSSGAIVNGVPVSYDGQAGFNIFFNQTPGAGWQLQNHDLRKHPRYQFSPLLSLAHIRRVSRLIPAPHLTMLNAGSVYQDAVSGGMYAPNAGIVWEAGEDPNAAKRNVTQFGCADVVAVECGFVAAATGLAYARAHFAMMKALQDRSNTDGRMFQDIDIQGSRTDQEYRVLQLLSDAWQHLDYLESIGIT